MVTMEWLTGFHLENFVRGGRLTPSNKSGHDKIKLKKIGVAFIHIVRGVGGKLESWGEASPPVDEWLSIGIEAKRT